VTTLLAVLAGGFAGAVARQVLFSALQERVGTRFPVGILVVNLSGAFVLGLLYGLDIGSRWPDWLATGAQTGLIGAYTTYSTWAVDSLALTRGGAARSAVVNLLGSLAAGVLLAWGGASIGSAMLATTTLRVRVRRGARQLSADAGLLVVGWAGPRASRTGYISLILAVGLVQPVHGSCRHANHSGRLHLPSM
jgi:CrcB protein